MRTPWAAIKDLFASWRRGEDPQRQLKWVVPYAVAGIHLTADQSLSLATVWACVDIIAKNVASCRWQIYEPVSGTNKRKLLTEDARAWMLNTRPNPDMTAIGFREAMLFQAVPFGNAYAEIVRDAGGRVTQLWPLMTDRMMPRRNANWELEYHYIQPDGSVTVLPQRKVFHVRGPGLFGLLGDNIIARAAKTLGVAAAQERFSASFFGQGAQPGGVLEYPGKLDSETHKRLKDDWADKFKGPENAHKPVILESGMKFTPITIDPAKSQLVEARQFSVEEICRWFGVPPHKVQHLEHATFSNIEHSSIEFVRDSLRPWERRLCQEADAKLFDQTRGPWRYTEIDLTPLTRGDAQSRALAQASWRQNGIMSANEIRQTEGLDHIEGDDGDVFLVPSNMTTIDRIVNPPAPLALGPGAPGEPDGDEEPGDGDEGNDTTDADTSRTDPDGVNKVQRQAVRAALGGALERYGRRLANRRAALATKRNADILLETFRQEQFAVLSVEMAHFDGFTVPLFGRVLDVEDMAQAVRLFERGEDFARALPTTTTEATAP